LKLLIPTDLSLPTLELTVLGDALRLGAIDQVAGVVILTGANINAGSTGQIQWAD
jgi:hypothetical protein